MPDWGDAWHEVRMISRRIGARKSKAHGAGQWHTTCLAIMVAAARPRTSAAGRARSTRRIARVVASSRILGPVMPPPDQPRSSGRLPRQALARSGRPSRPARYRRLSRRPVRRPQARRAPAALRPPARDGRRAPVVGGAQGPVVRHGRQAARGARRGPSARVRRLRGDHSARATTAPAA